MTIASAPGKINLALQVGPLCSDGYHGLASIFAALGLREYIVARVRRGSRFLVPRVTTLVYEPSLDSPPKFDWKASARFAGMSPSDNLAFKAARALGGDGTLSLTIHKVLPVAGGMAGGSADAAATLVAVNQELRLGLSADELMAVGRTLGADVPACLAGGMCLGEGRGDHITALSDGTCKPSTRSLWWVLVFFREGLSTPRVFQKFDELEKAVATPGYSGDVLDRFAALERPEQLEGLIQNDLQEPVLALRPELAEVGAALSGAGALQWEISGAGPTVVGLAASQQDALRIARSVEDLELPGVASVAVTWSASRGAAIERALPSWANAPAGSRA